MDTHAFVFTGVIVREEEGFSSLCLELDVASQGETIEQARDMLLEAVVLYLETAVESNLPYLRPVPPNENPRSITPEAVAAAFPIIPAI